MQVYSRYLEFPDGTFFPLPARPVPAQLKPKSPRSSRRAERCRPAREASRQASEIMAFTAQR